MKKIKYSSIPENLHLIITGEHGTGLSFSFKRDSVPVVLGVTLFTMLLLAIGTWKGIGFFKEKNMFCDQVVTVGNELADLRSDFDKKVEGEIAAREVVWQEKIDTLSASLNSRSATVEALLKEKGEIVSRYEEQVASVNDINGAELVELRSEYEQQISAINQEYQLELADLEQAKQAKQELLEKITSRLDERSQIIESMMSRIGVKVKTKDKVANKGGPFLAIDEDYSKRLLNRSDRYIETLKKMPLGFPVPGHVTSDFGRRKDPFVNKQAFHAGIDFKGKTGDKIEATADGVVKKSSYDKGLGHYVTLRHGNGYETVFGHMSKRLVKKGDKVERGQVIGLIGNSGRSTGSHLHYEVRYRGKAINPSKFLSVAKLSFTVPQ